MRYLVLLLIIVPVLEIGVILISGKTIGVLPTIGLLILTGVLGAYLAKKEGMETVRNLQFDLQHGRIPKESVLDGICIFIGGTLLLAPGFITDVFGFLLLVPLTRSGFKVLLLKTIKIWFERGKITIIR